MCIFTPKIPKVEAPAVPTTEELNPTLEAGDLAKKQAARRSGADKTWATKGTELTPVTVRQGSRTFISKNLGGTPTA